MNLTYEQKRTLYNDQLFIVDTPTKEAGNWVHHEWNHDDWISHIDTHGRWLHNNAAVQPYGYNVDATLQGVGYIIQTVQDNAEGFLNTVVFKDADTTKCELAGLYIAADEAIVIVDDYTRSTYVQHICYIEIDDVLEFVGQMGNKDD